MTLSEYLRAVGKAQAVNPSWRAGQAYFNVLNEYYPHLADQVRASAVDPYYHDERVPIFLAHICDKITNWPSLG